ncbi:Rad2 nuclease [Mortierella sp. AD010]|nr:Rad2 nuclease [Mortierella sp. AD010]
MGIQGLLPLLKSIEKPVHLKDYAGQTLAVDGYVWLHKGAFACAQELCLDQATQKYVTYFMRKIEMFRFFGVKPYIVFDGGYLPSKAITEQDRQSRRDESKKQAMELLRAGKSKQALEQFRKCVDVTPKMAYSVIQALEAAQVDFVVAPYEADAQLAYLEKRGLVDGIVTEDSDLLVFGCKKVIFKLDQYGAGVEILLENLHLVRDVSFHEWTMTEIRHMCILAGCDYLPSIPGMGLKTAQRLLRRFKTFERVIRHIRMENTNVKVQADYENAFHKADLTFLYARVYDPVSRSMTHLNPVPEELEELVQTEEYAFLGPVLDEHILQGIATGKLDPIHKTALDGFSITKSPQRPGVSSIGFLGKENKPDSDQDIEGTDNSGPATKKRTLEASRESDHAPLPAKSTTIIDTNPQDRALIKSGTHGVIVESRSRFFGFEATPVDNDQTSDVVKARKSAVREDSGIGQDEASLLYTPITNCHLHHDQDCTQEKRRTKSLPLKSAPIPSTLLSDTNSQNLDFLKPSSQSSQASQASQASQETLDPKSAESKVVQGWREKFSNPSGTVSSRAPGLNRAIQTKSNKARNTLTFVSQSMNPKSHVDQPSKAMRSLASYGTQSAGKGIIRTTPGHPVYCLDATRRPNINKSRSNSRDKVVGSSCISNVSSQRVLSQATEEVSAPNLMLNLDRFKYTPK